MYGFFAPTDIKPQGWLKNQLKIQANSLAGNLHKIWPDVSDSAWIGGSHESWERVPYWLDGFIPMAYYLENSELISVAEKYMSEIINRQQKDGWICPCKKSQRKEYDIWAGFLIGKVLTVYYEFSKNEAALTCLYKFMKCLNREFKSGNIKLFNWGYYRWYECFIPLNLLYENYKEEWITDLAKYLKENGADYFNYIESWKRPLNRWTLYTHTVNLSMMLKYEAVSHALLNTDISGNAEKLWNILEKYNGTAVGTFTGDECLGGLDNNRGTELCSVVELMYSCQLIYAITRKPIWAERMEKIAYNALPATFTDDMWAHQYDQQVNQIACVDFGGKSFFGTNTPDAHIFGLEPNFGCCTSNFLQGFSKLSSNAFLKTKKGILCGYFMPVSIETQINGATVKITEETDYPFDFSCKYTVEVAKPTKFELKIRIPKFAENVKLNGEDITAKDYIKIERIWNEKEIISITFSDAPHLCRRPHNMKTVQYGPLVFSLPISYETKEKEYEKNGVIRKKPYCDYELYPLDEWRYALCSTEFTVNNLKVSDVPFSSKNPPITITATLQRINWEYSDGYDTVSATYPKSTVPISKPTDKPLYPYGCSKLRITELPTVKKSK